MKNPLLILLTGLLLLTISCKASKPPDTGPPPTPSPTPTSASGDTKALSRTITGKVVRIIDGDTCDILDSQNLPHRIRLKGINCPERGTPFSKIAKQNLGDLIHNKPVVVEWDKRDRYGRIVGKVMTGTTDICLEQIKAGLAWHFKKYQEEQSEEDRAIYANAEAIARASRRGLWGDPISSDIPAKLRHHSGSIR